jgi:hypothetical protein
MRLAQSWHLMLSLSGLNPNILKQNILRAGLPY